MLTPLDPAVQLFGRGSWLKQHSQHHRSRATRQEVPGKDCTSQTFSDTALQASNADYNRPSEPIAPLANDTTPQERCSSSSASTVQKDKCTEPTNAWDDDRSRCVERRQRQHPRRRQRSHRHQDVAELEHGPSLDDAERRELPGRNTTHTSARPSPRGSGNPTSRRRVSLLWRLLVEAITFAAK